MFWQKCNFNQFIVLSNTTHSINSLGSIHILSGTFNPLHKGHLAIYDKIECPSKFFEIAIDNKDKKISEEQLDDIISQFVEQNLPLIVTKRASFKEKTALFHSIDIIPTFHMGLDTAIRLLIDEGVAEVQRMDAMFIVYGREGISLSSSLLKGRIPSNMHEGSILPKEVHNLSSTQIRNSP